MLIYRLRGNRTKSVQALRTPLNLLNPVFAVIPVLTSALSEPLWLAEQHATLSVNVMTRSKAGGLFPQPLSLHKICFHFFANAFNFFFSCVKMFSVISASGRLCVIPASLPASVSLSLHLLIECEEGGPAIICGSYTLGTDLSWSSAVIPTVIL